MLEECTMHKYILLFIGVLLLALSPLTASAHASLIESTPAANSVVAEAPQRARLRYSEPLEPSYSKATLLSSDGEQVSTAVSRVDPNDAYVMLLDLPSLPEGRYVLQWRALSTADGHTSQGTVSFAIGDPSAANAPLLLPPPPADPLALPSPIEVVLRWLSVGALITVLGSLVFGGYIWLSGTWSEDLTDVAFQQATHRLERVASLAVLIGSGGLLLWAAWRAEAQVATFLISSRVGALLALRVFLVLLLTGIVWRASVDYRRLLAVFVAALALLSVSLLSHSAIPLTSGSALSRTTRLALAVAFDWIHLLATAAWIGGLVPFLLALVVLRREAAPARAHAATLLVARFTTLATAAVITLGATGTFAAIQHITAVSELWTTTYGRTLNLKLLLFGVLLLLGAYNRWRVHPQLTALTTRTAYEGGSTRLVTRLRRSVGLEIGVGGVVLLAVGVLTAVVPAREAGRGQAYTDSARVGDVLLQLQVVPGDVAGDVFALDIKGLPEAVTPGVILRGAMTSHHAGEEQLELEEVEPGRWGARGSLLAIRGQWDVEAIVRASGMEDVRHIFTVDTSTPESFSTAAPLAPPWVLLILAAILVAAVSQIPTHGPWRFRLQTSSLLLIIGAFLSATIPYYVARATEQTNPLTETPEVLAAGQAIYQQNCVTCHGITGQGNGPAARSLPGLPGDFTQPHFATHTDGQLYGWIKGGKEGTAMPAFGEALSDEQVWQVITHLRSLYQNAQQAGATSR